MIDWALASRIAGALSGERQSGSYAGRDIGPVAKDAAQRIADYTGLTPLGVLPQPELVSRVDWIAANVASMRPVFDSVEQRLGNQGLGGPLGRASRAATGAVLSAHLGALIGFLSQRVLGQYDMPLLDPSADTRLLLVVPNLLATAERLKADRDDLLRWVTLHEVTHAVQFTAVPWLRPHLVGGLRELLDSLELRIAAPPSLRMPTSADLRELARGARRGELITFVIGRERRALVDRLQSTMAVIEGHAEHVMDAVGADLIPSQAQLRDALESRRAARSTPLRVLERILGIELKLRQYRDGKRFCDWVVRRGGTDALNRVWSSAQALPSAAELADPDLWMARIAAPLVTK